jgi:hypothetical protein
MSPSKRGVLAMSPIARNECKRCGVTVGNLHGVECVHSCERRVRLDQAERVEYVPADQTRGAVAAERERIVAAIGAIEREHYIEGGRCGDFKAALDLVCAVVLVASTSNPSKCGSPKHAGTETAEPS